MQGTYAFSSFFIQNNIAVQKRPEGTKFEARIEKIVVCQYLQCHNLVRKTKYI